MPRGRRKSTLGALEAQLQALNVQRARIIDQIRSAVIRLAGSESSESAIATRRGPGRPKGSGKKRGRRKLSAAARKAISDAQKKRWAERKASKK